MYSVFSISKTSICLLYRWAAGTIIALVISIASKTSERLRGWFPLIILPPAVLLLVPSNWPRWRLMWLLAISIFYSLKWLTWRRTRHAQVPLWRSMLYLLLWQGMDAVAFFNVGVERVERQPLKLKGADDAGSEVLRRAGSGASTTRLFGVPQNRRVGSETIPKPLPREWLFALGKFALGFFVLYGWARFYPPANPYWLGWIGMTGIILLLHFGSFHLLSCALRTAGIDAQPLMNWPLTSVRLSDYWSRGWNTAFRDLTNRFLFRPLARKFGPVHALWIGFLVSGLIHDVVVSIPARGGYGGPTFFFLIQAMGIMIERTKFGRRIGLGAGIRGWVFTMILLLLPAPLLFHEPFVTRIIVPFMHAMGAAQ